MFRRAAPLALITLLALPGAAHAVTTGPQPTVGGNPLARPTPAQTPSMAGSATQGQRLTASLGTWNPPAANPGDPVFLDHVWLRCNTANTSCTQVAGAVLTYTPTAADVGQVVRLRVRGTASVITEGFREADATGVVISSASSTPVAPTNVSPPAITGTAAVGQVLSVEPGVWNGTEPITYAYGWSRCNGTSCRPLTLGQRYRVTAEDRGSTVTATVAATNTVGIAFAAASTGRVTATPAAAKLKRLSPFPLMLIDGRVAGRTTRISTLRLRRVPGGATVGVSCKGGGCPYRRKNIKVRAGKSRTVAFKRISRMRSGAVLVLTVRKGETLGKYIRLRFRSNAAPSRVDRCVAPRSSKPVKCT